MNANVNLARNGSPATPNGPPKETKSSISEITVNIVIGSLVNFARLNNSSAARIAGITELKITGAIPNGLPCGSKTVLLITPDDLAIK